MNKVQTGKVMVETKENSMVDNVLIDLAGFLDVYTTKIDFKSPGLMVTNIRERASFSGIHTNI